MAIGCTATSCKSPRLSNCTDPAGRRRELASDLTLSMRTVETVADTSGDGVLPTEYAAHNSARQFFALAAGSDSPTVRDLASLGGHAARIIAAYIELARPAYPVLAAGQLEQLLATLLPLTDGRRVMHAHSELIGPARSAVARVLPEALVVLHGEAGAAGAEPRRVSDLLRGIITQLAAGAPQLADQLELLVPTQYLNHREIVVLTYPAGRGGDPGVLALLLGQAIPLLEIDAGQLPLGPAANLPDPAWHRILLADCLGARRLGFSYLDQLLDLGSNAPSGPPPGLRGQLVLATLADLGYHPDLPGPLGRALARAQRQLPDWPDIDPGLATRLLDQAGTIDQSTYHAAQCAEDIAPLLALLGSGIPPAQVIDSVAGCRWPSARAVLATSAVFNHVGIGSLRRYLRLEGPPQQDRLALRQRKDELVTKALELLSFGAAFENAPL